MAIQMRRGLKKDFDPTKMLAGEWAVCIDSDTNNQIVYMCFASGVVKRMGTYDDFSAMIHELSESILNEYKAELQAIVDTEAQTRDEYLQKYKDLLAQMQLLDTEVVTIHDDIVNKYLPQILAYLAEIKEYHDNAKTYMDTAEDWSDMSKSWAVGTDDVVREGDSTDNSKYYATQAHSEAERSKEYSNTAQSILEETMKKAESVTFTVNTVTGNLEYTSYAYSFAVNTTTGNLEYSFIS